MARRNTFWIGQAFDYVAIGTGGGTLISINIANSATLHEISQSPTIIRIVGRLWFTYERKGTQFQESSQSLCWAGIACMHEDVVTQSPKDSIGDEMWMWTGFMGSWSTFVEYPDRNFDSNTIIGGTVGSRGSIHNNSGVAMVDIDARAMRKAPEPCELTLSLDVEEKLADTGADHKLSGYIRALCKV